VFDVSPITEATALELGAVDNYYSMETAEKFLQDIVDAVERLAGGRRARIALKHKREQGSNRDHGYFRFVEALAAKHANFTVVPTQTSLYELIAGSALTISIPYSSPVYVASHLGRASVFYDPTGALRPTFDAAPGLEFAATPEALQSAIVRAVGRN
jgi:polysaccharide biosynthesis PFTS motif protein